METLKMTIPTSVWSTQHPKAGRNTQKVLGSSPICIRQDLQQAPKLDRQNFRGWLLTPRGWCLTLSLDGAHDFRGEGGSKVIAI